MSTARSCQQCGRLLRSEDRFCPHCGTGQRDPLETSAHVGQMSTWDSIFEKLALATAPRYRILRLLGYGGMAGVYLAEEPRLGRQVAIKVMSPALLMDTAMVSRFQQEARTTAHLTHPNIVTIFDVDTAEGLQYFVMAYVPGRSLANVMAGRTEPLPIDATLHWVAQIGAGLHHAHMAGIVHRDVKPGNILFDGRGNALVTDFGIAKVADEPSLTRTGLLVGTPSYMSPEQCLAEPVTGASDQYSLGVLTYEMLAGRPPFVGQTVRVLSAHVHETPAPLAQLRPDCPPAVVAAVEKMLAKKPADRYPSIAAAMSAMGARPLGYDDVTLAEIAPLTARVARLEVRPPAAIAVGQTIELEMQALDRAGKPLEGRSIALKSEDPGLLAVTGPGQLQAVSAGEAWVTVTCEGVTVQVPVRVMSGATWAAEPPTLEIVAPREVIAAGESVALEARVPGHTGQQTGPIAWRSSDPTVAHVTEDGRLTGIHPGLVTVTASALGVTASASLRIAPTTAELAAASFGSIVGPPADQTRDTGTPPPAFEPLSREPWRPETTGEQVYEPTPPTGVRTPTPAPTMGGGHTPPPAADLFAASPASTPSRSGTGMPAAPPRIARKPAAEPRRKTPLIAAVLGALVVAAIVVAVVLRSGGGEVLAVDPVADPAAGDPTGAAGPVDPDPLPPLAADTPQTSVAGGQTAAAPPAGQRGGQTPAPDNTRTGRPVAATPPPAPPPATPPRPAAPVEGRIVLGGALPAGATVTVRSADGRSWVIQGEPLTLPPGRYRGEVRARGYVPVDAELEVRAGETVRWTPAMAAVPPVTPPPPPPPARDDPPAVDPAAERAAIARAVRGRIETLAAAFETREMDRVIALYPTAPADWRTRWAALVENRRDVTGLQAEVASFGDVEVDGDVARVAFSMRLEFRDLRNAEQQLTPNFTATLRRTGGNWVITELR